MSTILGNGSITFGDGTIQLTAGGGGGTSPASAAFANAIYNTPMISPFLLAGM